MGPRGCALSQKPPIARQAWGMVLGAVEVSQVLTEGGKIGIGKPIPLMILDGINLLLFEQLRGRRNASLFAVGDRGGRSTKDPANCRQSLPPATAFGPEAPKATATAERCGPTFLGSGVSLVPWLAKLCAHRETRNRSALAPSRVADVLAPALKLQSEDGPPPNCAGAADLDPPHGLREPTYMSTPHVKPPPAPFLCFFLSCPFLLFDRAAGFLPPRPRIGAGRRAQMLSRLAALQRPHPAGASAFTASSNDGRLDRSGRLHSLLVGLCFMRLGVALFRSRMLFSAGLATKSMARAMFAST